MRTTPLLFICPVLAVSSISGVTLEQARLTNAEQDSSGRIWASSDSSAKPLLFYNGKEWNTCEFRLDLPNSLKLAAPQMARGPRSSVFVLWHHDRRYWVTEHSAGGSRQVAQWEKELFMPTLFVDSRGDVWITHRRTEIFRVQDGDSSLQWVGSLNPESLVVPNDKGGRNRYLNLIHAFEDGRGIVWFWSDGRFSNGKSLPRLAAFEAGELTEPQFKNLPQGECYFAVLEDPSHALIALRNLGLFRLDLVAREATSIPEPFPKAFYQITQITWDHDRKYVVSRAANANGAAENNLWVFHNWKEPRKVWDKVELRNEAVPWLPVPSGIVLGTYTDGLLFFPDDGAPPQRMNWRSGFPLGNVQRILALGRDHLWAGTWLHGSASTGFPPWPQNTKRSAADLTLLYGPPIRDRQRSHVWAISGQQQELQEWDGTKWKIHPAPKHQNALTALSVDTRDRIWGFTYGEVLLWDPAQTQWKEYRDIYHALEETLPADRSLSWSKNNRWNVVFSGDGRAAFWSYQPVTLNYFDGSQWKRWPQAAVVDGPIHFDPKGRLSIRHNLQVHSLEGENWIGHDEKPEPNSSTKKPRPNLAVADRDSVFLDCEGVIWFTRAHRLYRRRGSLEAPVFKNDEPNPFTDGRAITDVTPDGQGNAFLYTNNRLECVLVRPIPPVPDTNLQVALTEDAARFRLAAVGPGKHWFEWRLDDGDWSEPSEKDQVNIEALSNGEHTFEARALDERLQVDMTPAKAPLKVGVDQRRQVDDALADLQSQDGAKREKAVEILTRRGKLALPLLKERRYQADDNLRWWIDAAIQEAERAERRHPEAPGK